MLVRNLFFVCVSLTFLFLIYSKVKKKVFSEKESFFWVIGSIMVIILAIFPSIIDSVSRLIGINYPPSLLFLLTSLFLIYLVFRQAQQISTLNERVKELAQRGAIIENKISKYTNREL